MSRLELFNEYMILTSCYFMYIYSDGLLMMPNPDPNEDGQIADKETMWTIAWFQIAFMGVLVAANLVVMLMR